MLVIDVNADEISKALDGADTVKIEVPGAIQIADAKCVKCGSDAVDIEQIKLDAIMQAAGYVYDLAVACINEKKDIRNLKTSTIINNMMKQFTMSDDEIIADKSKNIDNAVEANK